MASPPTPEYELAQARFRMLWDWQLAGRDLAVVAPDGLGPPLTHSYDGKIFSPGPLVQLLSQPELRVLRGNWEAASYFGSRGTALGPSASRALAALTDRPLLDHAPHGIEVANVAICLDELGYSQRFAARGLTKSLAGAMVVFEQSASSFPKGVPPNRWRSRVGISAVKVITSEQQRFIREVESAAIERCQDPIARELMELRNDVKELGDFPGNDPAVSRIAGDYVQARKWRFERSALKSHLVREVAGIPGVWLVAFEDVDLDHSLQLLVDPTARPGVERVLDSFPAASMANENNGEVPWADSRNRMPRLRNGRNLFDVVDTGDVNVTFTFLKTPFLERLESAATLDRLEEFGDQPNRRPPSSLSNYQLVKGQIERLEVPKVGVEALAMPAELAYRLVRGDEFGTLMTGNLGL